MGCLQFLCLFLFHLYLPLPCYSSTKLCPHDQTLALLQFKNSFSIDTSLSCFYDEVVPYPKTASWEEGGDCCSWDGVTCDMKSGNVIELDLACSMLLGTFPSNSTLFLLPHLQKLDLSSNDFNGSHVSSQFGHFLKLTHLYLSSSNFVGHVPSEISHLSSLVSLDLSYNYELTLDTITFSKIVQNLTKLRQLHLSKVNMSLVVPSSSFMNLSSSLSSLELMECGLQGKFPDNILRLPNLQLLSLSNNPDLTGSFPPSNWSSSISLSELSLSNTTISIHLEVLHSSNLKSLKYLYLRHCNFIGLNNLGTLLGNLTQLIKLGLSNNNFGGHIPSSLGNLEHLEFLDLSKNNFIGQIPKNFANLTQLTWFYLDHNKINGQIPSFLGNLEHLESLRLSNNSFIGQIPKNLANLTQLSQFVLSNNKISGQIPSFLGNLKHLTWLYLSNNSFYGPIPSQLSMLSSLTRLYLSSNFLNGTIPSFIFSLPSLQHLALDKNLLSGHINEFQYNLLVYLDFSNNMLHGPIPSSIFKQVNLSLLILSSNNKLTGEITSSVCNLKFLQILDLSNNSLSGFIPQCLGNFSDSLSVLYLGANNFQGTIPSTFSQGNSLRYLNFNGNELKGRIPQSLINCRNLEFVDLGNNHIEDAFPYFLGALTQLQVLVLRTNKLYGSVTTPTGNYSFPKVRIFDLSNNILSGLLPIEYFTNLKAMMNVDQDMKYMRVVNYSYDYSITMTWKGSKTWFEKIQTMVTKIDLSCNKFTGSIPESIGKLQSLKELNFSHNCFTGYIQPSLVNLTQLEALDLSSNSLVGRIPMQLINLISLSVFNLSYNRLEGPIPLGKQFNTFESWSYVGNLDLCGFPLQKECNTGEREPASFFQEKEDSKLGDGFGWEVVLMGYGCGLLFGFTMGYVMFRTRKPPCFVRIIEAELHQKAKTLRRKLA